MDADRRQRHAHVDDFGDLRRRVLGFEEESLAFATGAFELGWLVVFGHFDFDRFAAAVVGEEAFDGVQGEDFSLVHDRDTVAEALGFFHVVRRVEDGEAFFFEAGDVFEEVVAGLGVDADGGFVEQDDFRAMNHGGGEVEAAEHAAGVALRAVFASVPEFDQFEGFFDASSEVGAAEAVEGAEEMDVFLAGQFEVECGGLRGDADLAADFGFGGIGLAVDRDHAAGGREVADHHPERGGLTGTVGAEEAECFAFVDFEGDVINRAEGAVVFDEIFDGEDRRFSHELAVSDWKVDDRNHSRGATVLRRRRRSATRMEQSTLGIHGGELAESLFRLNLRGMRSVSSESQSRSDGATWVSKRRRPAVARACRRRIF